MGLNRSHLASALVVIACLAACGDDDANENPKPSITASNAAASTGTEGAGGNGSGGGSGVGGGCNEDGCFSCEPATTEHFLNACTDSQCSAFDNEDRLPLFNGGDLPPVP
jgi:hypothetical protein